MYMSDLRTVFIRNLKFYRKKKGLRQLDLALEIGKSSNYINSIENGKYFPSPETIEKICVFLDIEPMRLFDMGNPDDIKILPSKTTIQSVRLELQDSILTDIAKAFSKIQ